MIMAEVAEYSLAERRVGKSAGAFRTISEVAGELGVPQHVLRFWETKFAQVKPLKRGGGRRYYRPEDVALLRQIKSLLYDDGYTIKGVQKLLKEGVTRAAARRELPPPKAADKPAARELSASARREVEAALADLLAARDLLETRS